MASTNKTPFLNLSRFILADKPKMTDFNNDNTKIDNWAQAHVADTTLHLAEGRSQWLAEPYVTGTYAGDGAAAQTVTLGFRPALLFVFAQNYGPIEINTTTSTPQIRFAAAADGFGTSGLELTDTGFTVAQAQAEPLAGLSKICMNQSGVAYRYFAMK